MKKGNMETIWCDRKSTGQRVRVLVFILPPSNHVALERPLFLFGTQFPLMSMHRIGLVDL